MLLLHVYIYLYSICLYFSRWRGQTSLYLTHKILLSEEPDSQETVTTSFPVTPFLSTLTSQVCLHADVCVCIRKWTVCLSPLLYTVHAGLCAHANIHACVCWCIFLCCSVIAMQSLLLLVTFLQNDFPSHLKGQLSFCLPASLEGWAAQPNMFCFIWEHHPVWRS